MTHMKAQSSRVVLIGVDGAIPEHLEKFAAEGEMPHVSKLMARGAYGSALPCPPCDTPTNWTTIATGANTGTHGITSFFIHLPGEPLDKFEKGRGMSSFDTRLCRAEYIWDAAEKSGIRSILVNYPTAWPPTVKRGSVVGGYGPTGLPEWQVASQTTYRSYPPSGIKERGGVTFLPSRFELVSLTRVADWKGKPASFSTPLKTAITVRMDTLESWVGERMRVERLEPSAARTVNYQAIIVDSEGKGYNELVLHRSGDASKRLTRLRVGEWSHWIYDKFGTVEGAFRLKLVELTPDGRGLILYRSPVATVDGWASPSDLCPDIAKRLGPFITGFELEDFERAAMQADLIADIALYLSRRHADWGLMMAQLHLPDWVNHGCCRGIDPANPDYSEGEASACWEAFRKSYRIIDQMVGRITEDCCDERTTLLLVSDHGSIPNYKFFWAGKVLMDAGLLVFKQDERGRYTPDWPKTKAYPGKSKMYVWVNLRGRDPDGSVEPGEEYEKVRDETIQALQDVIDPSTGVHPVQVALRKEDAAMLGQWGDSRVGDVVYFTTPGYGTLFAEIDKYLKPESGMPLATNFAPSDYLGGHDSYLPTSKLGPCSNQAVFLAYGHGIKQGVKLEKPVFLTDIAPTIAQLLRIKPPAQSEGRILREILT
jgi:predicted AlkP superfamily phosphohydrolase/phosphomutase